MTEARHWAAETLLGQDQPSSNAIGAKLETAKPEDIAKVLAGLNQLLDESSLPGNLRSLLLAAVGQLVEDGGDRVGDGDFGGG